MQTIQVEIADDKLDIFFTIINNLQEGIVQGIKFKNNDLEIETIEKDSEDFRDIEHTKSKNNPKYSIEETKAQLGL